MINIAVDARCLNYRLITGVNTYTLHFLHQLYLQKYENPQVRLIAIGLNTDRFSELSQEFPFMAVMWDATITLQDYLGLPTKIPNKILNTLVALQFRYMNQTKKVSLREFDMLFLPQPRALPAHPNTDVITIFHDLYGALEPSGLNWKQRIFDNLTLYKKIADASKLLWVNSISTGLDVQNFLVQSEDKVKLVYPALPQWEVLRQQVSSTELK
jgi:hypothetical protein